jgi:hypothetical protein
MVESLQKERAVLLPAARAAKTHPRLEEDENDREMKVSSSEPPTPQSAQAEPYTSVEEVVVPAPQPPFKEVRGKYRKRRTSPSTPQVQAAKSGPSREPPSAEAPKKVKRDNPPAPQAQPTRSAPAKTSGATETPGGKQNSAGHHPRRVPMIVGFKRDDPKKNHLLQGPVVRRWHPCQSGDHRRFPCADPPARQEGSAFPLFHSPRGENTPCRVPNGVHRDQPRRRQVRRGESRPGTNQGDQDDFNQVQ